jgi:energy-converting hydrogenase Eha subunit E
MMLAVFLMQLWLITIALEAFMAARGELALPTFLASGACFALNLWLLRYVYRIDREKD